MYNRKKAQLVQEKYLRQNTLGPKADDTQPITEKSLKRRKSDFDKIIEANFDREAESDVQIIEKVLNNSKKWRTAEDGLAVPPINTLVAKMEEDRRASLKTDKKPHWTAFDDDKKQQGALPRLKKNVPQHDKLVLNNDPRRFKSKNTKELVGGLTTAQVDRIVKAIKTGETLEYDAAILTLLKEADTEKRELTLVEQKAITDLKKARTKAVLSM